MAAAMKNNPYSLVFGKEPPQLVSRASLIAEVARPYNASEAIHRAF